MRATLSHRRGPAGRRKSKRQAYRAVLWRSYLQPTIGLDAPIISVLDNEADLVEAAFFPTDEKHLQPYLRSAVVAPYYQSIHGSIRVGRWPPVGIRS